MRFFHGLPWLAILLVVCSLSAQTAPEADAAVAPKTPPVYEVADKRIAGVLPNYRTVEPNGDKTPLTTKQKFIIAYKDSFDYPIFAVAGITSGIGHLNNTNPSYGQGLKGFSKRYIAGYADQAITNFIIEGALPSVLHHDPRYYRKGSGSVGGRIFYSATRVFVTPTDHGTSTFNVSEFTGNVIGAGLGNWYYKDGRTVSENVQRVYSFYMTDAIGNLVKEFWPDIKRRMNKNKTKPAGD